MKRWKRVALKAAASAAILGGTAAYSAHWLRGYAEAKTKDILEHPERHVNAFKVRTTLANDPEICLRLRLRSLFTDRDIEKAEIKAAVRAAEDRGPRIDSVYFCLNTHGKRASHLHMAADHWREMEERDGAPGRMMWGQNTEGGALDCADPMLLRFIRADANGDRITTSTYPLKYGAAINAGEVIPEGGGRPDA